MHGMRYRVFLQVAVVETFQYCGFICCKMCFKEISTLDQNGQNWLEGETGHVGKLKYFFHH